MSSRQPPVRALHAERAALGVHSSARLDRGPRQTARVHQRIQVPAASIEQGARIALRARRARKRSAFEQLDRRAPPLELRASLAYCRRVPRMHGRTQRAVLPRIASDTVPLHQVEDQRRGGARQRIHAPAEIGAEVALDRVRVELEPGVDLSSISARGAEPELFGLEQHHGRPGSRGVQRRRESGDAAAHHGHIGAHIALERGRRGRGICGVLVQVGHCVCACARPTMRKAHHAKKEKPCGMRASEDSSF